MPPELPGMYYDEQKGKYFKISADHLAPPGAKYSRRAIKREKEETQRRDARENHERWLASWTGIQRPKARNNSLYLADRETSDRVSHRASEVWTRAIESKRQYVHNYGPETRSGNLDNVARMSWDPLAAELLICTCSYIGAQCFGELRRQGIYAPGTRDDSAAGYCDFEGDPLMCEMLDTGGSMLLATPRQLQVVAEDWSPVCSTELLDYDIWTCASLSPGHRLSGSTAVAASHDADVALGGSSAVTCQRICEARVTEVFSKAWTETSTMGKAVVRKCSSVDWLDANVIVAGMWSGTIVLYDRRSAEGAARLRHPSRLGHVSRVDEHHLLVAGFDNQMHMYDLRWTPQPGTQGHVSGKLAGDTSGQDVPAPSSSPAYVSYPDYRYTYFQKVNLAFSKTLGVVASSCQGCQDVAGEVDLFDLWTGKPLHMPMRVSRGRPGPKLDASSLLFVDDATDAKGGARGPSLFVGREGHVEEWSINGIE